MTTYLRKVIKIRAEDSPNVRYALAQKAAGIKPTNEVILPGVVSWEDYQTRRIMWDKIKQCVGLDAEFYEGADILMFPPLWLNRAEQIAHKLKSSGVVRKAKAIGCDPAEGGDKTCMVVIDEYGIIELTSKKTPDTSVTPKELIALINKYNVPHDRVAIDRGGGGKEHADRLRDLGYNVRTVAFGESLILEPKRGITLFETKVENREEKYQYKNRRAEMYNELRQLIDPDGSNPNGFGIPAEYTILRHELSPIPLTYDPEGRLALLPKDKKDRDSKVKTLRELIGHSPDEADALVLAIHAMLHKTQKVTAGAFT